MKLRCGKLITGICLIAATLFCAEIARAQLSGSVGGSLSPSLDSNLNGMGSSAAPTPSNTIELGANNLMTPAERILPYDPTGASIMSTLMSPWPMQFYQPSRTPYQVDNSLKDVTIVTGLHPPLPLNITDVITRKSDKFRSSSQSLSSVTNLPVAATIPPAEPQSAGSNVQEGMEPQSFWRVGASATVTAINPVQPFSEPTPTSEQPSNSTADNKTSIKKKPKIPLDEMTSMPGSTSAAPPDYSRSPLEASYEDRSAASVTGGPFRSLDQSSFLDVGISARSLRRNTSSTRQKAANLFGDQTQLTTQARISDTIHDQNMNTAQSRLAKHSVKTEQTKRPKWHNPILQQMENNAVSGKQ